MKHLLLFIFVWYPLHLFAQQQIPLDENRYVDSLNHVLLSKKADSSKADASFLLTDYWKFKDTTKSGNYLAIGKKLGEKYSYYRALSYFYEGQYYYIRNRKKASAAFKKAIEALGRFKDSKSYQKLSAAWFNYGLMNKDKEGYDFVTKIILEKAIPYAEKARSPITVAHYYTQLSTILMNNSRFDKAIDYNQKAIDILEKADPKSSTMLFAYLSGVSIYCYKNEPEKAWPLLRQAKNILQPFPGSLNNTLYYYNETLYYITSGALTKAIVSAEKGALLARKYHQQQLHQQFLFRQNEIYRQQKKYNKARQLLLQIVSEKTLTKDINDKAAIYGELAKTSEKLKDYKDAYQWLSRYRMVSDSINNSQTKLKISELETKFRTVKNDQKITALQAENRQAALNAENNRLNSWFLGLGCIFLLAIIGFIFLNARSNRKLARQREINYHHQLSEMEQKQQLKIAKAMLDGEELERERVARDLHDGLGGMLAGVKINLSGWANAHPDILEDRDFKRTVDQLDASVTELRRIARNMVPDTLLKFGLETALKDLCEFYMREGLQISCESFNIQKNIPLNVQLNIYRIIQELISNSIRHSQAENILMQCSQNEDIIFITFEDDGRGFDPELLSENKGMGINNLKNRIAYLQGQFELLSAPGEGTTVNIELNTITTDE
ncbi:sensor histidine kinase [Chryseobacterium sp. SSA4.19]|uniref:tetratricopeptide repeat-containing sensor histidine kinase n=1 Tax=Chryseobacterium sp. SSA4.19 TaxID=2919915 RepID=UPI001F4DA11C|nr:sensor histidine kinase [Chryseobacterium sp. SSA4.19]MCJ8154649.1 sensor histidine kinase [Chryseobacterium sp. SSA4.19]